MSYKPIQSSDDVESCFSEEHSSVDMRNLELFQTLKSRGWKPKWLPILLLVSLNFVLAYFLVLSKLDNRCGVSVSTEYAGLLPELSLPWLESSEYSGEDLFKANELWESISFDSGIVALDKEFVESKGLPTAQPFPWDVSKSLYLINGYHNLHCTKSIHTSMMEWKFDKPQTFPFEHILHCVDSLRLEVLCQADDTPRYSTNDNKLGSGIGQHRQCRDWSKLESWAQDNSACYRYFNYSSNTMQDQRERFVFCPPESPYISRVEKYLKYKESL